MKPAQYFHTGMKNISPNFYLKKSSCLFNIFRRQPTRATGKISLPKFTNMLKYLHIDSEQQTKQVTNNDQIAKKRSAWLLFWQGVHVRKHSCFWFHKVAKFMERSENVKLNLNSGFWRLVLFTIFTSRKSFWITCSITGSRRRDRNQPITSKLSFPVGKH